MAGASGWWEAKAWPVDLASFVIVGRAFLEDRLSAAEFERLYLDLFSEDRYDRPEGAFGALEAMFIAVDEFELDDALRCEGDIDGRRLREVVVASLERLGAAKDDPGYRPARRSIVRLTIHPVLDG